MPALANLTLVGPGATNHVFKPRDIVQGVATLVESTGVPLEDRKATASITRTANGRVKVVLKLQFPVCQDMEVNGVTKPTLVRTAYADITLSADSSSTTEERQELIEMVNSFNGHTDVIKLFKDLESYY